MYGRNAPATCQKDSKTEQLQRIVEQINASRDGISSIREITAGIVRIINDPDSSAKDLKKLVEMDPPLTARVLKRVNSAFYAPAQRINEIGQAIIVIGFETVKELALSQKVSQIFDRDESVGDYSRKRLWKHSIAVALLGKIIYRKEFGERGEHAYAAGVLHDIGVIVEDQFLQDSFPSILQRSAREKKDLSSVENAIQGFSHADIGRAIARNWKFPHLLREAIGYHHMPHKIKNRSAQMASVLFIAEYAAGQIGYADARFADRDLFLRTVRSLGLSLYGLELMVAEMEQELARMENQGLLI